MLQAGMIWPSKIAKLAPRHSIRDEGHHHVIEMRRHFPNSRFTPMYASPTIQTKRPATPPYSISVPQIDRRTLSFSPAATPHFTAFSRTR
jgi:hypothetical protein